MLSTSSHSVPNVRHLFARRNLEIYQSKPVMFKIQAQLVLLTLYAVSAQVPPLRHTGSYQITFKQKRILKPKLKQMKDTVLSKI